MKANSVSRPLLLLGVLFTAIFGWFSLKVDVVKTSFFIGKNINFNKLNVLDKSIRTMIEKAGFDYYIDKTKPLSDDEIDSFFG